MNTPAIVSPQEWEAARLQLRAKEKELMRALRSGAKRSRADYPRGKVRPLRILWSGLCLWTTLRDRYDG
jgi:predicted dithiol-disulfide oxidoreductase (DUF899 family)